MPALISPTKFWQKFPLPKISKRQKFILTSLILTLGLVGIEISDISWRYLAVGLLASASWFLSAWSLKEGLEGIEWLTVLILPPVFTLALGLFSLLLLTNLAAKVLLIISYGIGIYILLLVGNIFSVAAIRTIQLLRSAQAVGFLFTLVISFFLYDIIFSFRLPFWENFLLVMVVSFPLILQSLWCINLEKEVSLKIWLYTLILSFTQGEMAMAFSFWPLGVATGSLALVTVLYITVGLAQQELALKLFPKTISEYLRVGIIVFLVIFLTIRWGG
jgi:hypothetical protein